MYKQAKDPKGKKPGTGTTAAVQFSSAGHGGLKLRDNRSAGVTQRKIHTSSGANNATPSGPILKNNSGLPDQLKSGIETLSGYSMDDVKVHFNSRLPAKLNAHAFAKGTDIHLAPGKEKHLPHEAWHVVQQKQGRVAPTRQLKGNVDINDDGGLEREADVMGGKALQMKTAGSDVRSAHIGSSVFQLETKMTWTSQTYDWNGNSTVVGEKMEAFLDPGDIQQGQSANMNSSQDKMMKAIKKKYGLKGHELVKGHLLNDNVGGPASDKNLFPITKGANGAHLHYVENKVKSKLQSNEGLYYEVKVEPAGKADISNNENQFRTVVADWDVAKPHTIGNTENREIRIINSNLGTPGDHHAVTDENKAAVDSYKDEKGSVDLPEPAKNRKSLVGTKYELVLFASKNGHIPHRVDWEPAKKKQSGLDIKFGRYFSITDVEFDTKKGSGKVTGNAYKSNKVLKKAGLTFNINKKPGIEYGGYVDKKAAELHIKQLSPIEFSVLELRDDGLHGEGDVKTTIPLIRGAGIKLKLSGNEISLVKKFDTKEFHFPAPFKVTNSNLSIHANATTVWANGFLDFGLDKVGAGHLEANAGSSGLRFDGDFVFDSKLFNTAKMSLSYEKGQLKGQGNLKIGTGKVPGLKEATADATYSKSGLHVSGTAKPGIPGINASLSVDYDNGAFKIEGWGAYHNGMLRGNLTLGFTNQLVDENSSPTSAISDRFSPYGSGTLAIDLGHNLQAEASAKLLRNAEVEMRGKIGIAKPAKLFDKKSVERSLFEKKMELPLYAAELGIAGAGIYASIGASASLYAGIGPGTVDKLSASVLYNPSHPEKTQIDGEANFEVPASAQVKTTVPVGIVAKATAMGLELARGEGRLDLGGQLRMDSRAAASADLTWTAISGLEFNLLPQISIKADLKFDVDAALDIQLATGYKKQWNYKILEKEIGPLFHLNVEYPVHYKEREPFIFTANDLKITENNPEKMLKGVTENAGKQAFVEKNAKESGGSDNEKELVIFVNRVGSDPHKIDWPEETEKRPVDDLRPPLSKLYKVTHVAYEKGVGGSIAGVAFAAIKDVETLSNLVIDVSKSGRPGLQGVIESASVKDALQDKIKFPGVGSAKLSSAEFAASGLAASGKLHSHIQLLKDADIDFVIADDQPSFKKVFSAKELNVPGLFKVTKSSLVLSTEGGEIGAEGLVDFTAGNLGKGKLSASMKSGDSLKLAGEFDLDKSYFDNGKVKMSYHDGVFQANGSAKLKVPGLKEGNTTIHLSKDSYKIGGGFSLDKGIPGISGGKVDAELVHRGSGKFDLSAKGSATSSIPGIKTEMDVQRVNGAWLISGEGAYKHGQLAGKVKLGVTNQGVDEKGKLNGAPGKKFSVYGGGQMKFEMVPWATVQGEAQFLPNGEPEISGAIKLATASTFFNAREYKPEPYTTPAMTVPIYAIPVFGYNIGLEGKVKGGTLATAKVGPGRLQELSANMLYNPYQKSKNKLSGKAKVTLPTTAELRVFGSAGVGTNAVVASIYGSIEIGGALPFNAPMTTEATVGWFGNKGFKMEAMAEAIAKAKLKADVTAALEISVSLAGTRKWDKKLKEWDFGSGLQFGARFPVKYEGAKGFDLTASELEIIKPDINFASLFSDAAKESFQGPGESE